jgi:hypothetical protein
MFLECFSGTLICQITRRCISEDLLLLLSAITKFDLKLIRWQNNIHIWISASYFYGMCEDEKMQKGKQRDSWEKQKDKY